MTNTLLGQRRRDRTRLTSSSRAREPRTLHLLDLENLLGGKVTTERCRRVWREYCTTVGTSSNDQFVLSVAQHNGAIAAFGLPANIQRVLGDNRPDGADRSLVEAVDVQHAAARFDRVVIGSGDHYFASLAVTLRQAGCEVAQVLGAAQFVAAALYCACSTNYVLPIHHDRGHN